MRNNDPFNRDGRAADRAAANPYQGVPGTPSSSNAISRRVIVPSQTQNVASSETRARDPHLGLRFWIQLGQIEIAGFRECSGLNIETEVFEFNEGGVNNYTHKLPVRAKYGNITLKRGLDAGQDLHAWYMRAMRGEIKRQNISIIVYDYLGQVVQKWDLQNAFPCKWTGPDLNTEQGAVAVETVEIAHEGLLPSSGVSNAPQSRLNTASNPSNTPRSTARLRSSSNANNRPRRFW
jgi:phage tail-like protein